VAGGIAAYLGVDCGITRLVTAAVVLFTGVGPVLYILAWIFLPEEGSTTSGFDHIMSSVRSHNPDAGTNPNPNDYR